MKSRLIQPASGYVGGLALVVPMLLLHGPGCAEKLNPFEQPASVTTQKYCGVYALYAYLRLQDQNIDLPEMITPRYISHPEGSTIQDLITAAEDHGFNAIPITRLNLSSLKQFNEPAILHIWRGRGPERQGHYLLLLGHSAGLFRVFDPPGRVLDVTSSQLTTVFSGNAVLLSRDTIHAGSIARDSKCVWWLLAGIVSVLGLRVVASLIPAELRPQKAISKIAVSAGQTMSLLLLSGLIGIIVHFFSPDGFLHQAPVLASLQEDHFTSFLQKVNRENVKSLVSEGAVLVDARWRRDFDAGHIQDARNIEPDATIEKCRSDLSDLALNHPIIVYCQSETCPYAVNIAKKLSTIGYTNLSYYRGGWIDWVSNPADE